MKQEKSPALCFTEKSKYAKEINADNWYPVLQRNGVTYGRSDPDLDPCGYRTLMVWQLAEKHYNMPGLFDKSDVEAEVYDIPVLYQVSLAFEPYRPPFPCFLVGFGIHQVFV